LQAPTFIDSPQCGVAPYRRWRKTEEGCLGDVNDFLIVDHVRTNLTRELGIDPCFSDTTTLHSVNLDGINPPCQIRKLDGSEGPVMHFR
ncbi:hypothetical protein PMAYCL1PPCAC_21447, partial [Pristionchus mayeri]